MRVVCLNDPRTRAVLAIPFLGALVYLGAASPGAADDVQSQAKTRRPDHVVRSTPENVTWGDFPSDRPPVAVVRPGEIVRIDTLSHAGATQGAAQGAAPGNEENHPVRYLAQFGVKPREVLKDVVDFWLSGPTRPRAGRGGHILTGPIYVEGAEPGDMLEVEVLDLKTRVPYGINK
jgi:acetamidase/formamidase